VSAIVRLLYRCGCAGSTYRISSSDYRTFCVAVVTVAWAAGGVGWGHACTLLQKRILMWA